MLQLIFYKILIRFFSFFNALSKILYNFLTFAPIFCLRYTFLDGMMFV